ncbi:phosphoglycerate dehydrogenase [Saccharopolyspora erythraea]|uniref:phosphoglycerate dehydrogenase n=1 Tax=Saccharopolyspora erythraea TaxID=1836 RepID=UPI001BA54848|nr:phosphoglycerate dehydrogenase [Saccharopolyspora erythraea]QUH03639.1 phosphoglycerate dehydrogenase [Saccharopolyspora erythraea]
MTTTLITTPTFGRFSPEPWEILDAAGSTAVRPHETRAMHADELLAGVPDADALIVGMDQVTAEVIEAGSRLRVIAKHGVGVDNIDLDAARARGIPVVFAPGSNSRAVAELTFGLMIAAARRIAAAHTAVVAGDWPKLYGPELAGRTLGIIGFGRIGRLLAGYAQAFGMTVLGYDPFLDDGELTERGVRPVGFSECLAASDFVSLHLPAEPGRPPLLDQRALRTMKQGACLVNAARGGLVDETALAELLHSGHLGAAALDAFATEPLTDSPLRTAPNLLLTPHIGACSHEANRDMGVMVAEDVARVLRGELPHHTAT